MSWFSNTRHLVRCGAIVDVGSGSVGCAIVSVNTVSGEQHLIWTHREYTILRSTSSETDLKRALKTALVNVFLELGSNGLKTLSSFDETLSLTDVQVSLSAPWQYTTTRNVHLTDTDPFVVDEKLLSDLNTLAKEEAIQAWENNKLIQMYQLEIVDQKYTGITIDGYKVSNVLDRKVSDLSFSHLTTLAHDDILEAIYEAHQKITPQAKLSIGSFMYKYFSVTNVLYPHTYEACLIDVTNDATEIGIVRDNTLTYVSHTATGTGTLARTLAEALSIPVGEALTLIRDSHERKASNLSDKKMSAASEIFSDYQEELITLMKQTGDDLSIPHTIFVHSDTLSEQFYKELLSEVSNIVTNSKHTVHPVTSEIMSASHTGDTAILLGVQYYTQHIIDSQ